MSESTAWPAVAEPGTVPPSTFTQRSNEPNEPSEKKSAAALLVDLALERYTFGVTPEGDAFAAPLPAGHVVRPLRGGRTSLRAELASAYRTSTGRVAPQQALADALLVLEGEGQDAAPVETHLRVATSHGAVWIDIGDVTESVVRLDADGWQVVDSEVPVLFRRTALTGALPMPVAGGNLADLWDVLNVEAADRPLVLAWLVAALARPSIPHPALAVFGEQGTGKSSACRTLVQLVDPSPVPLRKPPRDPDGWVTAAAGSWVVALDNLSAVPDWLSDALCRAVTGDGDVRRQLYTDAGLAVFAFRRAVVMNGIDLGSLRGDLAERLIVVNLERISEGRRATEHALTEAWARTWSSTFGALLDLASDVLRVLPSVRLEASPRMADFALIVAAVDDVLGTAALARYADQSRTIAEDSLDADPFLVAMRETITDPFVGVSADLLELVSAHGDGGRTPKGWPASARAVTGILKRNAPALRKAGWTVEDLGAGNKAKVTLWSITPPATDGGEAGKAGNEYGQSQEDSGRLGGEAGMLPSHSISEDSQAEHALITRPEIARIASPQPPPYPPTPTTATGEPTCTVCHELRIDVGDGATTHPDCAP